MRYDPGRRGFTLVELLVAMLITTLVAGSAITVLYVFIFHFEQTSELTAAQQNGQMVLTILRNPVLHAGLGMPSSGDPLVDAFGGENFGFPVSLSEGPLVITDSGAEDPEAGDKGNILWVLYGFPSNRITLDSADLGTSSFDIELNSDVDDDMKSGKSKTTNWALFPTAGVPLRVVGVDGKKLTLEIMNPVSGRVLAQYDGLYLLRGMKAYIDGEDGFYTVDLTREQKSPRVENIPALYFDHSNPGLLKVYVVAAGPTQHDEPQYENWKAFTGAFPEWPEKDTPFDGFDSKWKFHRMRVLSETWRIRN